MIRFWSVLAMALVAGTYSFSQTYWVQSAAVSHSGGWPSVNADTTTPPFGTDGYWLNVYGQGGQVNPGGLQVDGVHGKVDAHYGLYGSLSIIGAASHTTSPWYTIDRQNVDITFKIRCSHTSTPPAAGAPVFSIRARAFAEVHPVSSPFTAHGIGLFYYIPPSSSTIISDYAEAQKPGGNELDETGYVAHRNETGATPPAWTNVGTNLWETTVTVPKPTPNNDDQDLWVYLSASSTSSGGMLTSWAYASSHYEYRCISIGAVSLQAAF